MNWKQRGKTIFEASGKLRDYEVKRTKTNGWATGGEAGTWWFLYVKPKTNLENRRRSSSARADTAEQAKQIAEEMEATAG